MGAVKDFLLFVLDQVLRVLLDALFLVVGPFLFVAERFRDGNRRKFSTVAITGANSGIGEALAKAFAKEKTGMNLLLIARDRSRLQGVKEACEKLGAQVTTESCDVTNADSLNTILQKYDDAHPIDLLIANAGVTPGTLGVKSIEAHTQPVFDINVNGVFNTVFPIMNRMRQRKQGTIALVSSLASYTPMGLNNSYHAAKAAVRYFGEGLRALCAADKVNVVTICPGFVRSPMTDVEKGRVNMVGLVELDDAVATIKDGIQRNVGVVNFPFITFFPAEYLGSVHPVIRSFLQRILTPPKPARKILDPPQKS